jgi:hypothetical protein
MRRKLPVLLLVMMIAAGKAFAQDPPTGPRKEQGQPLRLVPVPPTATGAQVQAMLDKGQNIYFGPGTYNIGNLQIKNRQGGLVWGAGRLTTTLNGTIRIAGTRQVTLGNFSISSPALAKGAAVIEVAGTTPANLTFLHILVSGTAETVGIRVHAPGQFVIQGCNPKWSDIGIHINHPRAYVNVFGGNLQYNRVHIRQERGHLDARAFGMQGTKGDADIVIKTPSPAGYHILEGIRSEGSNGTNPAEVLLQVPPTNEAVNVALRANTLGSMVQYADYNANGRLILLENVNYPGSEDKRSVGVKTAGPGKAVVVSYGNKYGLSYDAAPGPFVVSPSTTVRSMGDLWMLPNKTDYKKPFNEPVTGAALEKAGKTWPKNISFPTTAEAAREGLPRFPLYKAVTLPRIANLGELMINVRDYGAVPGDGKDDRAALQKALEAAVTGGISAPLYIPAGRYELAEPLFLDQLAGGGFWGDGAGASVLASTTGKGVITTDGAGYAVFADLSFENSLGAETKTVDFDWVNDLSAATKRGKTGAALQANMFYRCRFENGRIGLAVGKTRMGDGFLLADCEFKNNRTARGEGAGYVSEGFNALTNPLVHCLFEEVDHAVINEKGSFNFYGNKLGRIRTAALKFNTMVGDGFALIHNTMDSSSAPFIVTGHSSAKAHILVEGLAAAAPLQKGNASRYTLGGSVLFSNAAFPNRVIANGGGIGDNSLLVFKTVAADILVSGRAHGYFFRL